MPNTTTYPCLPACAGCPRKLDNNYCSTFLNPKRQWTNEPCRCFGDREWTEKDLLEKDGER